MTGSLFGIGGSAFNDFSGDPKFRTLRNTKSPGIASRENALLGDFDSNRTAGQAALGDYISKYLAGSADAGKRTEEEMAPLNRLYDGGFETDQAGLRARRLSAATDMNKWRSGFAQATANRSMVGSDGSGGTYRDRLLAGVVLPYQLQAQVQDADQASQDYYRRLGLQTGMAGTRQGMADTLAQRSLVPATARQQMFGANAGNLGSLTAIDEANNIYGVQQKTTGMQRWGKFLNDLQSYQDKDEAKMASTMSSAAQSY